MYNCKSDGCKTEYNTKLPYPTMESTRTEFVRGYWTSTAKNVATDNTYKNGAWRILQSGMLNYYQVNYGDQNGIRPVIEISKDLID